MGSCFAPITVRRDSAALTLLHYANRYEHAPRGSKLVDECVRNRRCCSTNVDHLVRCYATFSVFLLLLPCCWLATYHEQATLCARRHKQCQSLTQGR